LQAIRQNLAEYSDVQSAFSGEIEVDESFFLCPLQQRQKRPVRKRAYFVPVAWKPGHVLEEFIIKGWNNYD